MDSTAVVDSLVTSSGGTGVSFTSFVMVTSFGVGSKISERLNRFSRSKLSSTTLMPQTF